MIGHIPLTVTHKRSVCAVDNTRLDNRLYLLRGHFVDYTCTDVQCSLTLNWHTTRAVMIV